MITISNYAFVNCEGIWIMPEENGEDVYVLGDVNGEIKKISFDSVENGVYSLGRMCPDYLDFINASIEGISTLYLWKSFHTNPLQDGSDFSGVSCQRKLISGKVVAQEGNYIVLRMGNSFQKFFVIWDLFSDLNTETMNHQTYDGHLLAEPDFSRFGVGKTLCRPSLVAS